MSVCYVYQGMYLYHMWYNTCYIHLHNYLCILHYWDLYQNDEMKQNCLAGWSCQGKKKQQTKHLFSFLIWFVVLDLSSRSCHFPLKEKYLKNYLFPINVHSMCCNMLLLCFLFPDSSWELNINIYIYIQHVHIYIHICIHICTTCTCNLEEALECEPCSLLQCAAVWFAAKLVQCLSEISSQIKDMYAK